MDDVEIDVDQFANFRDSLLQPHDSAQATDLCMPIHALLPVTLL